MPTSNRYQMPDPSIQLTDELIMHHIDRNSRVIDLGCGDGRLMQRLHDEMGCEVMGVEVEQSNIVAIIQRGLPAIAADLNEGLVDIPNDSFDFAVLSQTLQQVRNPKRRTPITQALPYEWYETPNVHFMSMRDFRDLMDGIGLRIVKESPIIKGRSVDQLWGSNLRADSAFYLLERDPSKG